MHKRLVRVVVFSALLLMLLSQWGCSTQKDRFANRAFHTINAKYNGFFNARESYREGVRRLEEAHQENFEQVLPVFRYGAAWDPGPINNHMEVAYEKASLVIMKHSMDIRGVEHNRWIDESYYLIARSHYFKRDFNLAIITFEYIIREYDTARSYDSKVWIAKCYHQQGRYDQARQMLDLVETRYQDGLLESPGIALFRKTFADHFLRQGNYAEAARQLSEGIPYMDNRADRARQSFVLAQLYQHAGNYAMAQQTYTRLLDMRRLDFRLAFQAKIGMAMAYDPETGGSEQIRTALLEMIADDRNRTFRDQLFYALSQLAFRQGDEEEAIEMLRVSIEHSEDNPLQKGLSHLRLGEIFFNRGDYLMASDCYDEAVRFLPASFLEEEDIRPLHRMLSDLAGYERTIQREDSLQRLASLPPERQAEVVDKLMAEKREQMRLEEEAAREATGYGRAATPPVRYTGSGWYFYNTNALRDGEASFNSRFGRRPLEDLWRISNKQLVAGAMGFDDQEWPEEELTDEQPADARDERAIYLSNIPNSEEAIRLSNERLMDALYQKGILFRDGLKDDEAAIEALQQLIDRYPDGEYVLNAYYYLYQLLSDRGMYASAQQVRSRLISSFPDSGFARYLSDPAFADELQLQEEAVRNLYKESYLAFSEGRFQTVFSNMVEAETYQMNRELEARFLFLYALARYHMEEEQAYRNALEKVLADYEDTPVYPPASMLLAAIDQGGEEPLQPEATLQGEAKEDSAAPPPADAMFTYDPDVAHFVIILVDTRRLNPTSLIDELSAYNEDFFQEDHLAVNNVFFEEGKQMLTITSFRDKEKAMAYFYSLSASEEVSQPSLEQSQVFVISMENYPVLYQEKKMDAYQQFFDYYY